MNNSTIAWKTRAQLDDFMVKMFHGFPKPQNKFIRDMVYGIQATGDTIITDIARAVAPEDKHRNVENRLSRNLQAEGLHEKIRDAIQADAARPRRDGSPRCGRTVSSRAGSRGRPCRRCRVSSWSCCSCSRSGSPRKACRRDLSP